MDNKGGFFMKTAYFYGPEDVRIEEAPIPEPGDGEVVIKNKVALTCGTDLKTYLRGHPLWIPPTIFGHEASGIVHKVGKNVTDFKPGDRVVAHNSAPCNECIYCKTHLPSMCENNLFNSGAFAEYQKIPERIVRQNMFKLPDTLDFKSAALTEPFSCAVYGIDESNIKQGDYVVINGAGPIGLMFIKLAYLKGAHVIATDMSPKRLDLARKLGAKDTINIKETEDIIEAVKNLTPGKRGVDVAVEATGLPEVWEKTILMSRKGATVNLFGGTKKGTTFTVDCQLFHYSQLTVKGVFHTTPYHVERAFRMICEGVISADDFVNEEFKIDDLVKALESHRSGNVIKNAIIFD